MSRTSLLLATVAYSLLTFSANAAVEEGLAALEQGDLETAAREFQQSFEAGDADGR